MLDKTSATKASRKSVDVALSAAGLSSVVARETQSIERSS